MTPPPIIRLIAHSPVTGRRTMNRIVERHELTSLIDWPEDAWSDLEAQGWYANTERNDARILLINEATMKGAEA
jgi:hypothetical protein